MPTKTTSTDSTDYDYLIIGCGIAGATLAHQAINRGLRVLVLHEPSLSHATNVAAGIINPIFGKRFSELWNRHELIADALAFYRALEHTFAQPFLYEHTQVRLFTSADERDYWFAKRAAMQPSVQYVSEHEIADQLQGAIEGAFGGIRIPDTYHVELDATLTALQTWLVAQGALREEVVEYSHICLKPTTVEYKGITARTIVCCEGWKALQNPLLSWLPLVPAKGELLTIRLNEAQTALPYLVQQGVFLLPLPDGLVRVGATYEWDELDEIPTEAARNNLSTQAAAVLRLPFSIVRHDAAVRPASDDRKPIVGLHPTHPRCAVVNGLGAKGVVFAPFVADALLDAIEYGSPIDETLDIQRFAHLAL